MRIQDGKVRFSMLCSGCLQSEYFTVDAPGNNDIAKALAKVEEQAVSAGWRVIRYYPYIRYYCPRCREAASDYVMKMEKMKMQSMMVGNKSQIH